MNPIDLSAALVPRTGHRMGVLSSLMSKMTKCWERTSLAQPRASPVGSRGFGFGFAQRTHVLYIYIGLPPAPPPSGRRGDLGAGTSPAASYIYIICASGEEPAPTRPHEVYWRKPGGEKADGTTRLGSIAAAMRVLDPQMTPQNRHPGGALRRQIALGGHLVGTLHLVCTWCALVAHLVRTCCALGARLLRTWCAVACVSHA